MERLTCIYRNKTGEVLKTEPCQLDNTIGYLIHHSFQTEGKYCLVEISDQAEPQITISITGSGISTYRQSTIHQILEVTIEIELPIFINSQEKNLALEYKNYFEENITPLDTILNVGGNIDIQVEHSGNTLKSCFTYEMYEEPYHYMVDLYSLFIQARQLKEIILNFEKK
jgi:hypothetical protein